MRKCGTIDGNSYIDETWNLGYFGGNKEDGNRDILLIIE